MIARTRDENGGSKLNDKNNARARAHACNNARIRQTRTPKLFKTLVTCGADEFRRRV